MAVSFIALLSAYPFTRHKFRRAVLHEVAILARIEKEFKGELRPGICQEGTVRSYRSLAGFWRLRGLPGQPASQTVDGQWRIASAVDGGEAYLHILAPYRRKDMARAVAAEVGNATVDNRHRMSVSIPLWEVAVRRDPVLRHWHKNPRLAKCG